MRFLSTRSSAKTFHCIFYIQFIARCGLLLVRPQSTEWVRKTAEKFKSVSSNEGGREGDGENSDTNINNGHSNDDGEFVQMSPVDAGPIMHLEYVTKSFINILH